MWPAVIGVLAPGVAAAAALVYGSQHWKANTRKLHKRLEAARIPLAGAVDFGKLDSLPSPVERYFRVVLKDGQSAVAAVSLEHSGAFNIRDDASKWKPFTSVQRVITQRPGFDWDARIIMMPGLPVRVHDAYVAGEGLLDAALFGLVPLARIRGTGAIAQGELMRFLAEAAWYPTVLLPCACLHWEAVDDRSANATFTDGPNTVRLLFHFNEEGLVDTVRAEARGRVVGNQVIPTAWQARVWNYEDRDGICVPLDGEVAWLLPDGPRPYWRGHLTSVEYEFIG
jgi:hypothetical protein